MIEHKNLINNKFLSIDHTILSQSISLREIQTALVIHKLRMNDKIYLYA